MCAWDCRNCTESSSEARDYGVCAECVLSVHEIMNMWNLSHVLLFLNLILVPNETPKHRILSILVLHTVASYPGPRTQAIYSTRLGMEHDMLQ